MINLYHKLSIEETLKSLDVNPETGLSDKEASLRIANEKKQSDGSSFFKLAASGLSRPVIYLLLIAALLSALLGGVLESCLILAVIVLHTVYSAECKRRGLRILDRTISASVTHAIVLRNGAKMKLASDELVVGDVVTIKPGRVVPADLRLITSEGLVIDESALTGRASVEKNCDEIIPGDVSIELRDNCAFEGTVVLRGRADGVVTATGMSTEMSRLTLPLDVPERDNSPTFSRLEKLSKRLTLITFIACIGVFAAGIIRDTGFVTTLVSTLALAVAVIPEGIFTAALVSLSRGAKKLKESGFNAKTMRAVETLGEVSVLCTDIPKIGVAATYTNGRIRTPQEEDTVPFLDGLLLCELSDPSLRSYASHKCNSEKIISDFPKIGELVGEVTTTLHRAESTTISYTGGEAEEILSRSVKIWELGHIRTLTESDREDIRTCISSFTDEGYALTALGFRSGDDVPCDTNLIFLGIAATRAEEFEPETPDTEKLAGAGVRVYLLTESDAEKARLGAAALSLPCENIICGREVSSMNDEALRSRLFDTFVFCSLRAQDKVRIIKALKSSGACVATVGDGLSDAPALDASDIGLSDIHSQDAAKDASDVIYDGAASADEAILRGKIIHRNIKNAVTYLTAANSAELICVLLSVAFGLGFPLTPSQILLINLITDTLPALWLASRDTLSQKRASRLNYIWGAALGAVSFVAFWLVGIKTESLFLAQWATFALLALGEILFVLPIRFSGRSR